MSASKTIDGWLFAHEAPINTRILSRAFFGIHTHGVLWYSDQYRKWMRSEDMPEGGYSSHYICRSFKAFKRHLRKHPELRNVPEVELTSLYIGYNITARWYDL